MSQEEKKIVATIKLKLSPGNAKMPEVAAILGQKGIASKSFIDRFNSETAERKSDKKMDVKVIAYSDKTFDIYCPNTPSVSNIIKEFMGWSVIKSKNGERLKITREEIEKIATIKYNDLLVKNKEAAIKTIEGSLRSMAVNIVG